jgi:hypothetical protein
MKKWMKLIAFAAVAFVVITGPALATTVSNTFNGIIVASDIFGDTTTNDISNYFGVGGGSLLGQSFSLTFTTTAASGTTFITGTTAGYDGYSAPNPITAVLTINGHNQSTGNSSDGFFSGLGTDYYLQAFTWSSASGGIQTKGVAVGISPNLAASATWDLTTHLPAMLFANGDFNNSSSDASAFYDNNGEYLALDVLAVNTPLPVPVPPSALLLGTGLLGAVSLGWRRKISQ